MSTLIARTGPTTDRRPDIAALLTGLALGATGVLALCATVAALYLVKSALGINLFARPSPLHDLLYHLVR